MEFDFGELNYLAIVVGVVINMALGALWYSPVLLGKPWMAAAGITAEDIEARKGEQYRGYAVAVVVSIVLVFVLALLTRNLGIDEPLDGLVLGLVAGIGLVAVSQAPNYSFEGRPLRLFLINLGYSVVGFAIIGVLLAVWQ
jgi:ABC-type uncharacterized transport system permease subunit